jgi:nucleotide-binding universal stress UspA family protein
MYKKALVPLDGSDLAARALPQVGSLVEEGLVEEVTLLNVVNVDLPRDAEYPIRTRRLMREHGFDIRALRQPLFAASAKYLAGAEARLSTNGVTVKTESIEAKRPANAITDYAQKNGTDLIVMSTHGYSGLKKLFMGCVAAEVLSQSPVPVLLIRPEA